MYFGIHIVMDQLCQLEGVHAAGSGAVFVVFVIPAANAMHNGDALGRLAVFQGYFSAGGAAGIDQAFKFHGGEHVIQAAITELGDAGRIEILETGCQHDRAHGQVEDRILSYHG